MPALVLLGSMAGCGSGEGTTPDGQAEPEVTAVVVSAGTSTTVINSGIQSGTLALHANNDNVLTVRFLQSDSEVDSLVAARPSEFEVRVIQGGTSAGTNVFTPTNMAHPYTGIIRPSTVGTIAYEIQLYGKEHRHVELTWPLAATVSP